MISPFARLFPLWGIGLGLMIYGGVIAAQRIAAATKGDESLAWPTTPGEVTSSERGRGNVAQTRGTSYSVWYPNVTYRYRVGDQSYTGTRVDFSEWPTKDEGRMLAALKRFPVGTAVTVHYRAEDPHDSVLDAGASSVPWKRKVLGVCGVGALIVLATYLLSRRFAR